MKDVSKKISKIRVLRTSIFGKEPKKLPHISVLHSSNPCKIKTNGPRGHLDLKFGKKISGNNFDHKEDNL